MSDFEFANNIRAVWLENKTSQSGMIATQYDRHPKSDEIIKSKVVVLENLGLSFSIPQINGVEETILKLQLNDRTRGIVDHYISIAKQDLDVPVASIVISELPQEMRNFNVAINAVKEIQTKFIQNSKAKVFAKHHIGFFGEYLEILTQNRISSTLFPTSNYTISNSTNKLETIGVSRFAMVKDYLVEFSIIVVIPHKLTNSDEIINYASNQMEKFWIGLSVI